MAHLKIIDKPSAVGGRRRYFYIVQNRRRGDTTQTKVLEYLGRDPDPKRLKRALEYWGVKAKKHGK